MICRLSDMEHLMRKIGDLKTNSGEAVITDSNDVSIEFHTKMDGKFSYVILRILGDWKDMSLDMKEIKVPFIYRDNLGEMK